MECCDVCGWLCAYLDKELDSTIKDYIHEHLISCAFCRRELEINRTVKFLVHDKLFCAKAPISLRQRVVEELARIDEYRESGIEVLDLIRWGTHIAQLYNSKDELIEVLIPYLIKGLEQNELCVWVTYDISENEAKSAFKDKLPRIDKFINKGQLQILPYETWYLPDGHFNGESVINDGLKKCRDALRNGYSGLRVTGTVAWLMQKDWDSFMEYESLLDSMISNFKLIVVCTYKQSNCPEGKLCDILNTHRYVICKSDDSWKLKRQ